MWMWIVLGVAAWFNLGFLGRCIVKHGFIKSGLWWDRNDENLGLFIILMGPLGFMAALVAEGKHLF